MNVAKAGSAHLKQTDRATEQKSQVTFSSGKAAPKIIEPGQGVSGPQTLLFILKNRNVATVHALLKRRLDGLCDCDIIAGKLHPLPQRKNREIACRDVANQGFGQSLSGIVAGLDPGQGGSGFIGPTPPKIDLIAHPQPGLIDLTGRVIGAGRGRTNAKFWRT